MLGVVLLAFVYWEVAAAATAAAATAHIEPALSRHVLTLRRELWHAIVTSLHALGVFIATIFLLVNLALERALLLLEQFPRTCLLYTSPSPRDKRQSRMPSSA